MFGYVKIIEQQTLGWTKKIGIQDTLRKYGQGVIIPFFCLATEVTNPGPAGNWEFHHAAKASLECEWRTGRVWGGDDAIRNLFMDFNGLQSLVILSTSKQNFCLNTYHIWLLQFCMFCWLTLVVLCMKQLATDGIPRVSTLKQPET